MMSIQTFLLLLSNAVVFAVDTSVVKNSFVQDWIFWHSKKIALSFGLQEPVQAIEVFAKNML